MVVVDRKINGELEYGNLLRNDLVWYLYYVGDLFVFEIFNLCEYFVWFLGFGVEWDIGCVEVEEYRELF